MAFDGHSTPESAFLKPGERPAPAVDAETLNLIARLLRDQLSPKRRNEARGILKLVAEGFIGDEVVVPIWRARAHRKAPEALAREVQKGQQMMLWVEHYMEDYPEAVR